MFKTLVMVSKRSEKSHANQSLYNAATVLDMVIQFKSSREKKTGLQTLGCCLGGQGREVLMSWPKTALKFNVNVTFVESRTGVHGTAILGVLVLDKPALHFTRFSGLPPAD